MFKKYIILFQTKWYLWKFRHGLLRPKKVHYIGGGEVLPPPLSREEERTLIASLARGENTEQIRQTLIERNLRLVVYIARKFENTGIGVEDSNQYL